MIPKLLGTRWVVVDFTVENEAGRPVILLLSPSQNPCGVVQYISLSLSLITDIKYNTLSIHTDTHCNEAADCSFSKQRTLLRLPVINNRRSHYRALVIYTQRLHFQGARRLGNR